MFMIDKENTIENAFVSAEKSGNLRLSKRTLRSMPSIASKFNMLDLLSLDISQNKLTEVPKQLCNCPYLLVALYSHNLLKALPDELIGLRNLQLLDLSYNSLISFPQVVCRLELLQTLLISNNKLTALPAICGSLASLVVLDASNNEICAVCPELSKLQLLRVLKLRNNALETVPKEWSQLRVQCLDLADNQLSALPPEFCDLQPTLTELHLELNPINCPPANVCSRGLRHALKFLSVKRRQILAAESLMMGPAGGQHSPQPPEMPSHYCKSASSSRSSTLTRGGAAAKIVSANGGSKHSNSNNNSSAETSRTEVGKVDGPQPATISKSVALSASPHHSVASSSIIGAPVQYSSSSSVLQRLEQQSNRLGGSWTLPRRLPASSNSAISGLSASMPPQHVQEDVIKEQDEVILVPRSVAKSGASLEEAVLDDSRMHCQPPSLAEFCGLPVAAPVSSDAATLTAMRGVFERRLGVRLPDRPERMAECLADGQLLGRLVAEVGAFGFGPASTPGSAGPVGFSDLCRRLGVTDACTKPLVELIALSTAAPTAAPTCSTTASSSVCQDCLMRLAVGVVEQLEAGASSVVHHEGTAGRSPKLSDKILSLALLVLWLAVIASLLFGAKSDA